MRVLVVEDNPDTLAMLGAVLRYEQYDVMTASNGAIALAMAKLSPPDVALLDIGLPGMDGYAIAQALRKEAAGRPLYIVAITGYGKAEDKERAAKAGFDAHLTKPAHPFNVIKLLEEFESRL